MRRIYATLIIVFSFIAILSSCNPEGSGIFMKIAHERKIRDSDFAKRTIIRMAEDSGTIYASAGKVFFRLLAQPGNWQTYTVPSGYAKSDDIAILGTDLYAVFVDGSSGSLFKRQGNSWSKVPGAPSDVTSLFSANGRLFVQSTADKKYRLYSSSDGSVFDLLIN